MNSKLIALPAAQTLVKRRVETDPEWIPIWVALQFAVKDTIWRFRHRAQSFKGQIQLLDPRVNDGEIHYHTRTVHRVFGKSAIAQRRV